MQTAIDSAGRIVVPLSAMREALGLTPGQRLDISERDGRLELEPIPTPMHLERRGKRIVAVADVEVPPLGAETVRDVLTARTAVIAVDFERRRSGRLRLLERAARRRRCRVGRGSAGLHRPRGDGDEFSVLTRLPRARTVPRPTSSTSSSSNSSTSRG